MFFETVKNNQKILTPQLPKDLSENKSRSKIE